MHGDNNCFGVIDCYMIINSNNRLTINLFSHPHSKTKEQIPYFFMSFTPTRVERPDDGGDVVGAHVFSHVRVQQRRHSLHHGYLEEDPKERV